MASLVSTETTLHSLGYDISLVTAFLEIVCKKRMPLAQQLQMSPAICPVSDIWELKQKTNFMNQFAALKVLYFCLWAFQYGKGIAQKPLNLTSIEALCS